MHRYHVAAGFFLLAGSLRDAVTVCLRQLQDVQLACVLCRLVEGENSETLRDILQENVMEMAKEKKDVVRHAAVWDAMHGCTCDMCMTWPC